MGFCFLCPRGDVGCSPGVRDVFAYIRTYIGFMLGCPLIGYGVTGAPVAVKVVDRDRDDIGTCILI